MCRALARPIRGMMRAMPSIAPSLAVAAIAACQQETIGVQPPAPASDYGHSALIKAIDAFVGAGLTPEAFRALAQTVTRVRPGMDAAVAREAERKLLVLALDPVVQLKDQPVAAR